MAQRRVLHQFAGLVVVVMQGSAGSTVVNETRKQAAQGVATRRHEHVRLIGLWCAPTATWGALPIPPPALLLSSILGACFGIILITEGQFQWPN